MAPDRRKNRSGTEEAVRRGSDWLAPFCGSCGAYKGIGTCRNPDCSAYQTVSPVQTAEPARLCALCDRIASAFCSGCGGGFCTEHGTGCRSSVLGGLDHHIGLCAECGEMVCENCWITDSAGNLRCLKHREEKAT